VSAWGDLGDFEESASVVFFDIEVKSLVLDENGFGLEFLRVVSVLLLVAAMVLLLLTLVSALVSSLGLLLLLLVLLGLLFSHFRFFTLRVFLFFRSVAF